MRTIIGTKYTNYEDALLKVDLETQNNRREQLCLKVAKNCLKNDKTKDMFKLNNKNHDMKSRKKEKYEVNYANTGRYKDSAIPYMQRLLNNEQYKVKEETINNRIRRPG